jgi:Zn-dependent protease with chaperone function
MSQSAHDASHRENQACVAANRRRVRILCLAAGVLPALVLGVVLGLVAGPVVGAVVAVVVLAVVAVVAYRQAVALALAFVGGRPVRPEAVPALATQVDGLCGTFGVRVPQLRLVDEAVPNSCALAGPGGREVLVVTTGLLARLDLIELEGVLAHELSHVKRHDAVVSAVAVATVGVLAALTGADRVVHRAVGRGREYGADQAAVLAVRYPPGLHGALCAFGAGTRPQPGSVFTGRRWSATRWIWIDPMVGAPDPAPGGELDATAVRMEALGQW